MSTRMQKGATVDSNSDETGEGSEVDEISDAADELRSDQWGPSIIMASAGLVLSAVLVFTIVNRVFLSSGGPSAGSAYAQNEEGARGYLEDRILPQLEMKYKTDDHPEVGCEQQGEFEASGEETYTTEVRCERPDTVMTISVDVRNDGDRMYWESGVVETESR